MLPAAAECDASKPAAADNQIVHDVFVIGPGKKIKLILVYTMTRPNFDELLRVNDSTRLIAKHKVATPVNSRPGEEVIIVGSVAADVTEAEHAIGGSR